MTEDTRLDRRRFVQITGAAAASMFLAGCSGSADGDDGSNADKLGDEPDYEGWFSDVSNYDGTVDKTGSDEATVDVGAGNGLSFGPAAVAVSPGTTVVWEWTGKGSDHNVSAENGDFESETTGETGFTFEHTFEESGVHKYACTPHRSVGMKGAVVVQ
ncbi:halocyanin domain-containing protein [Natronoarchaeum sp. GCM10025703]|uniref:halocyanin domain-containing protein n=1 Tax=unclassified Natronoarchaeum TaxID=2620183 RepID=UPI003619F69B